MKKSLCIILSAILMCAGIFAQENDVVREAYKGRETPIVINYVKPSQKYTAVSFCNISETSIKRMSFSYVIYNAKNKKILSKTINVNGIMAPFIIREVKINSNKKIKDSDSVVIESLDITFEKGNRIVLSKDEIDSCMYDARINFYEDSGIRLSLEYRHSGKYVIIAESDGGLSSFHYRFDTEEYEDEDTETMKDFVEGTGNAVSAGMMESEIPAEMTEPLSTAKSLTVKYAEKELTIDNEEALLKIRSFMEVIDWILWS